MKHVVLATGFEFSTEPFPAFWPALVYWPALLHGRKDRAAAFLPVRGVVPRVGYKVVADGRGEEQILYEGPVQAAAEAATAAAFVKFPKHRVALRELPATLPENEFRVVKTRDTVMIVEGGDYTPRCLLVVEAVGGVGQRVSLLGPQTTGLVLAHASKGTARENRIAVMGVLEPGMRIGFEFEFEGSYRYAVYEWTGTMVREVVWSSPRD